MTNNFFGSDLFTAESLTAAINEMPYLPGIISEMKLFQEEGIATTKASIELNKNVLKLIHHTSRGAPAPIFTPTRRQGVSFEASHLIQRSTLLADSIQDLRQFGTNELQNFQLVLDADHLVPMRQNIESTIEYHRIGAIKGLVLDASGSTLFDLFAEFGVTQQTTDFELDVSTVKVQAKVLAAKRLAENALGVFRPKSWKALCSSTFFDALIGHSSVENFAAGWTAASILRDDVRDSVRIGGVDFIEYRGCIGETDFIAPGEAYLIPEGVPGLFLSRFAPADYAEAVNTLGLPLYAKSHILPYDRGVTIEAQSNPINLCAVPSSVIKLTA